MTLDCWDPTIEIVRGSNHPPVVWQVLQTEVACGIEPAPGDIFDLTGAQVYLTIYRGGLVLISLNTIDNPGRIIVDVASGKITWPPTLPETRLLPLGCIARYELERRTGSAQARIRVGSVSVSVGENPD